MRPTNLFSAPLILLLIGFTSFQQQAAKQQSKPVDAKKATEQPTQKISVTDFGPDNVIGHLGHPLGTVVRVTGTVIDGTTTRSKGNLGRTLLEIHTVNGKALEQKVLFEFLLAPKSVAKPKHGNSFDYYAHELGAFSGVVTPPKELNIDSPMTANDGFHYRRQIAIHKSLK